MGCGGDWDPACAQAGLTLDANDDVWKGTFALPAGDFEYKAAIDGSWAENYGARRAPRRHRTSRCRWPPAATSRSTTTTATHWATSDAQDSIVTVPGSFQSELGCAADWDPACMRSWLKDPDGDGVYTLVDDGRSPQGSYEAKVTHGLSFDENYGAGGAPDGANIPFTVPAGARTTFSYDVATHVLTVTSSAAESQADLTLQKAHWLERGLLAWDLPAAAADWTFRLHAAPSGGMEVDAEAVTGGTSYSLTLGALPESVRAEYPHLAAYDGLRPPTSRAIEDVFTGQVAVAAYDDLGRLVDATGVQLPGVLDDVYAGAADRELGVVWHGRRPDVALWAPTAKLVDLLLTLPGSATEQTVPMRRDRDGVWTARGNPRWAGAAYAFAVQVYVPATGTVETNVVTDPYSLALTTNSARSLVVNLDDAALAPPGWAGLEKPELAQPEDSAIYELHVRDFSIGDDVRAGGAAGDVQRVHAGGRGRHAAPVRARGRRSEHRPPAAGVRPRDGAGVPRRSGDARLRLEALTAADPAGTAQQECIDGRRRSGRVQLGLRPAALHRPGGLVRHEPGRARAHPRVPRMVAALNGAGLRVVMDVVYNHTHAAGQDDQSVLDRIVPGYYQRLSATGAVETSTCCANTASEHAMMEKLIVDSVVTWARDYKVDGFRFDLMGHHSRATMERVRAALDDLTVARDGVDGARSTCTARAGTSARWRQRPVPAGHAAGAGTAPASARSTTGCATACAAAARSTRTRGSRASAPACSPTRTARP